MTEETAPRRVLVAGDWHGRTAHAVSVIRAARRLLDREREPLVIQLGDFGLWPGAAGRAYVNTLERECAELGVAVWFVDGNHDDATQLHRFDPGQNLGGSITHLPRGWRWEWHGRTWLALGGAVSLDKAVRREGVSWWPEEEITGKQAEKVIADGPAEVLLSHDCPSGVVHTFPPPPSFWDLADLARNDRHRERLQGVVDAVQPRWLLHGHLHRSYQLTTDFGYGPVEVTGLDCDPESGGKGPNFTVLDVKRMEWAQAE